MVKILISLRCEKCKEMLDGSLFRQFINEVKDIVVDDEAYVYGFDYSDKNIYFNVVGYETPCLIDDRFNVRSVNEFTIKDFTAYLRKLPRYIPRSRKEKSEVVTSTARSRSRSKGRWLENKKMKKDIKRACVDNVCFEA